MKIDRVMTSPSGYSLIEIGDAVSLTGPFRLNAVSTQCVQDTSGRSRRAKSLCGRFAKTSREKSTVSNEAYATLSVLSAIARDIASTASGTCEHIISRNVVAPPTVTKVFQRQPWRNSSWACCNGGFSQNRDTSESGPTVAFETTTPGFKRR
jgi:hypothetical protein